MKVIAKKHANSLSDLLRTGGAALLTALVIFGPVYARAQDAGCAPDDAQIYFGQVNEFMEAQGREAFSWNETLARTAEEIAEENSRKGGLQKPALKSFIPEGEYDLSRVNANATIGGRDIKKAFQNNLSDFRNFLLKEHFKDAGTACVAGKNGKGPYRALVLGIQKTDLPESERSHCGPGYARAVLSYTNDYRKLMHLPLLTWDDQLARAAEIQADYMAEIDNAQHEGPGGNHSPERAEAQGYDYHWILENVASGQTTPLGVVMGWRRSPGHDKNLRNPDVTEMGAACADRAHTRHQIFWVQDLGSRR